MSSRPRWPGEPPSRGLHAVMVNPDPATAPVVSLRRPPIRQSTTVRSGREHTFGTFVATIGAWWPVQPFSVGQDQVRDVTVESRVGGRVYETWRDGTVVEWGQLLAWEPPGRFVMTWTFTPVPTEVEFTFTALGPALTRVTVEHRGWEALSEPHLSQDCAVPGGYRGGAYSAGWTRILATFTAADIRLPPAAINCTTITRSPTTRAVARANALAPRRLGGGGQTEATD